MKPQRQMNKNSDTQKFQKNPRLCAIEGELGRRPALLSLLLSLLFITTLISPTFSAPITFQYIYDDTGQLIKVIDSTGTMVEYFYDETGNRIGVKNSTVSGVAIFNFTPKEGPVEQSVTIQGQGFKSTIADNIVKFNGSTATITAATANNLTVTVPAGASTGTISVAVIEGTAISGDNFTLTTVPVITALNPKLLTSKKEAATVVTGFKVTGTNLSGASFEFLPAFVPPVFLVGVDSINVEGTLATLNFTIPAERIGSFTLTATTAIGRSDSVPTLGNTMRIIDINTDTDHDLLTDFAESSLCTDPLNPDTDTDDDGFSDGDEVSVGTDPCNADNDPTDTPTIILTATGSTIGIMNEADPPTNAFIGEAVGSTVSVINEADPPVTAFIGEAVGSTVSVINEADPPISAFIGETTGSSLSIMNEILPPTNTFIGEATGPAISVGSSP